jgi:hypothetical protein
MFFNTIEIDTLAQNRFSKAYGRTFRSELLLISDKRISMIVHERQRDIAGYTRQWADGSVTT